MPYHQYSNVLDIEKRNISDFWSAAGITQPVSIACTPPSSQDIKPRNSYENQQVTSTCPAQNVIPNPRCIDECCPCKEDVADIVNKREVKKVMTPLSKYGIYSVQFSPDGTHAAVGYGNGGVCVIRNNQHSQSVASIVHGQKRQLATLAIKFHKAVDLMLTAGAAGEVNAWDFQRYSSSGEPKVSLSEEGNEINTLDICRDGMIFATAGKDRHIRLYDANSLCIYHVIAAPDAACMDEQSIFSGHTQKIFALKFHPDENHLFVTAGWDNCMKIWDKRMSRSARQSVAGPRICGSALDLNGNYILTGSYVARDAVQLWDLRNGNFIRNVHFPHDKRKGDFIYSANFVSRTKILAGGSGMNRVFGVDLTCDELTDVIEYDNKAVVAVDSCNTGSVVGLGGVGGIFELAYLR